MPTLGELMEKFGSAAQQDDDNQAGDDFVPASNHGHHKTASGGDMKSLTDIYLNLTEADMHKEASAAAYAPTDDEVDFAKMAEALADAEAEEYVQGEQGGYDGGDIVKIAQEYDSAGRIMARGFYDEFCKLAGALDTAVSENQMTESPSHAATPALGSRGLPTLETNFAGTHAHDQAMVTAGMGPKQVYADSLAPTRTISAGAGTGDDPEAAAISLGSGSPAGFATVKDLQV